MTASARVIDVSGPYYDELSVGQRFTEAPGMTLTAAHAAMHQAILGDRVRLALDADLGALVLDSGTLLAHPGLVCDVAIGQSTLVTQRVIANLFYRDLVLLAAPRIGDTLKTTTEVVGLRDNSFREGRDPTGLALLRIRTVDQARRDVLDFYRCAMLPMSSEGARPGHQDDFEPFRAEVAPDQLRRTLEGIDLRRYREIVPGAHGDSLESGSRYLIEAGETVSSAPELARLTLNIAAAHTDPSTAGRGARLVYGGHTIGIALAHVTRALPNLVTVAAWHSCDHVGPVFEGDVLRSSVTVDGVSTVPDSAAVLVDLHVEVTAAREGLDTPTAVLDWKLVGVMAA